MTRLPAAYVAEWGLTVTGEPVAGQGAVRVPVTAEDGTPAVLKVARPDAERAGELPALQHWAGRGAVRVLRADPRRGALLLERTGPDDLDSSLDHVAAAREVAALYPLLHVPASPVLPDLRPLVTGWLDQVTALPRDAALPRRFVEQALAAAPGLLAGGDRAVLHGDLHGGTVRRSARGDGGWLATDPSGHAGDPAYEVAPLLWHRWDDLGDDPGHGICDRFWAVVDESGLDERRTRDWVVVRAVTALARTTGLGRDDARVTRAVVLCKAMQAV